LKVWLLSVSIAKCADVNILVRVIQDPGEGFLPPSLSDEAVRFLERATKKPVEWDGPWARWSAWEATRYTKGGAAVFAELWEVDE